MTTNNRTRASQDKQNRQGSIETSRGPFRPRILHSPTVMCQVKPVCLNCINYGIEILRYRVTEILGAMHLRYRFYNALQTAEGLFVPE